MRFFMLDPPIFCRGRLTCLESFAEPLARLRLKGLWTLTGAEDQRNICIGNIVKTHSSGSEVKLERADDSRGRKSVRVRQFLN